MGTKIGGTNAGRRAGGGNQSKHRYWEIIKHFQKAKPLCFTDQAPQIHKPVERSFGKHGNKLVT